MSIWKVNPAGAWRQRLKRTTSIGTVVSEHGGARKTNCIQARIPLANEQPIIFLTQSVATNYRRRRGVHDDRASLRRDARNRRVRGPRRLEFGFTFGPGRVALGDDQPPFRTQPAKRNGMCRSPYHLRQSSCHRQALIARRHCRAQRKNRDPTTKNCKCLLGCKGI
jgi:hypothetical protein